MFREDEMARIDRKYFDVLQMDIYDVTLRSKNTGHIWNLHSQGYSDLEQVRVFHKHRAYHRFHYQRSVMNLKQAIKMIKDHDRFQIEVRGGG